MIQNVKFPCFVYTHGNYVARQKKETKEKGTQGFGGGS
jgi:hypothetical protein